MHDLGTPTARTLSQRGRLQRPGVAPLLCRPEESTGEAVAYLAKFHDSAVETILTRGLPSRPASAKVAISVRPARLRVWRPCGRQEPALAAVRWRPQLGSLLRPGHHLCFQLEFHTEIRGPGSEMPTLGYFPSSFTATDVLRPSLQGHRGDRALD